MRNSRGRQLRAAAPCGRAPRRTVEEEAVFVSQPATPTRPRRIATRLRRVRSIALPPATVDVSPWSGTLRGDPTSAAISPDQPDHVPAPDGRNPRPEVRCSVLRWSARSRDHTRVPFFNCFWYYFLAKAPAIQQAPSPPPKRIPTRSGFSERALGRRTTAGTATRPRSLPEAAPSSPRRIRIRLTAPWAANAVFFFNSWCS